jgi:ribosomal protein S18 acetylase RimI-like enzyme
MQEVEEDGMTIFKSRSKDIVIRPMTSSDIEEVRSVGQMAWTDLATRDVGRKVKYPKRSEKIIEAYMSKEPNGCLVVEEGNRLIGSGFCHVWGRVGWIGPLEVLPNHQDLGVGKALLAECERYLDVRGCQVIGLETMPNMTKNLHFYLSSGFIPDVLTLIVEKYLHKEERKNPSIEEVEERDLYRVLPEISDLSTRINALLDYSQECEIAVRKDLGYLLTYRDNGRLEGFSLVHTYQRMNDEEYASVKLLAVNPDLPDGSSVMHRLLEASERRAVEEGKLRMMARHAATSPQLYSEMSGRGYGLRASNLRMIKKGRYEERGLYNLASWAG